MADVSSYSNRSDDSITQPAEVDSSFQSGKTEIITNGQDPIIVTKLAEQTNADILKLLQNQSVAVSEDGIRRNHHSKDGLFTNPSPDVLTLYDNLDKTVREHGDRPSFGYRAAGKDYVFLTYNQFRSRALDFGAGLIHLGIQPKQCVGLYSKNRLEWEVAEHACNAHTMPTVAIYDTFGIDATQYIINHAELPVIISAGWAETTSKLVKIVANCPSLKFIIQMDEITEECRTAFQNSHVRLLHFSEVEVLGKEQPSEVHLPLPTDIAVIMYTSGTTGPPKGVMHSHKGFIAALAAVVPVMGGITPSDTYLSYLPLAHIFERIAISAMVLGGARIGFYSGDVKVLFEDLALLKPTILCGVPRVFERIYLKLTQTIDELGTIKKMLFKKAVAKKTAAIAQEGRMFTEAEQSTSIYNKIVFDKLKNRFGGMLRLIISGAAPLPAIHQEFLKVCFGCPILQGYGLTETAAAGTVSLPDDRKYSHAGPPIVSVEIKLVPVPEMNYSPIESKDQKFGGEVWIRGAPVAMGYYKDPEKTREDFDQDGWFHTGDIGKWNPTGTLSIIDRKKNIFKLSQGEYIAAEKLEMVFARSKLVGQMMIYGDSYTPFIIAIVRPEREFVTKFAAENGQGSYEQVCEQQEWIKSKLADDFAQLGKEAKIQSFENIKAIIIANEDWTVENDLLTPTFKLKRNVIRDHFRNQILDCYIALGVDTMPGAKERMAETGATIKKAAV
eukprot:TRINITY_DN10889_c0_g1_i1.p1 TRINITY_DN10889_c0_g1~~TRINITY_DN10889_c0_g1_i1.p1  ORF type:complete len:741 (-),score=260.15 TRINITY_DN10889_c0_g1_i1:48-2225(-)